MCVRSSKTFYGSFNLDMDRSPGFGSTNTNSTPYSDLVSLRLRTFSVLNLAGISNSPDRSTKSTPSARRPLTVCKHKVSGSLSLPSRGPFPFLHSTASLSVTRSIWKQGVVPGFPQGFSCLVVLWILLAASISSTRAFTVYGWLSQNHSSISQQC